MLYKDWPEVMDDSNFTLKKHVTDPSDPDYEKDNDKNLHRGSLIEKSNSTINNPLLLVCITMYNEHPLQLIESLIGVYRAYYELVESNPKNVDKVQVVVIIDGYNDIKEEYLQIYEKAGIYNSFCTSEYKYAQLSADKRSYDIKFSSKIFYIIILI